MQRKRSRSGSLGEFPARRKEKDRQASNQKKQEGEKGEIEQEEGGGREGGCPVPAATPNGPEITVRRYGSRLQLAFSFSLFQNVIGKAQLLVSQITFAFEANYKKMFIATVTNYRNFQEGEIRTHILFFNA